MANYPSSASTDANLYIVVNNLATSLNGALTASGDNTSGNGLRVVSTTGFPTAGFVTVELEIIMYTGISTYSGNPVFTGITRGSDGTTAATHTDGLAVSHFVIAKHHNVLKDEIKALESNLLPGQITGTSTNDSASAGTVGEYVEAVQGTATSPSGNNQYTDLTSISLTAGDWDVTMTGLIVVNGATFTQFRVGLGTTAGDDTTGMADGDTINYYTTSVQEAGIIPPKRFSFSTTTTVYAKFLFQYSSGTPKAIGRICARRSR